MSRTLLRTIALTAFTSATVWLAGHNQEQVLAQAPPVAPQASPCARRAGRTAGASNCSSLLRPRTSQGIGFASSPRIGAG